MHISKIYTLQRYVQATQMLGCLGSHCAVHLIVYKMALKWEKNDYGVDRMDENGIGRDKGR